MKTVSKLAIIALSIVVAGCNEKVSPELQSGNSTTPTTPTPTTPTEYYFSVENSSPSILGYRLHKTGAGNASKACEVRTTTPLSNDNFRGDLATNDVTCYFEAEELALFNSGFALKANASKDTCQYVSYRPFGYFNRMPGDSTATYNEFTCGNSDTTSAHIVSEATLKGINTTNVSGAPDCNTMLVDQSLIPTGTRRTFTVESDEDLCAFNYNDDNPMDCDIGEITINSLAVTYNVDTGLSSSAPTTRKVKCGGKVANCVQGPIKDIAAGSTDYIVHNATTAGADYTKEYTYAGLSGSPVIFHYSNFRRDLANLYVDYGDALDVTAPYKNAWNSTFNKVFNPNLMDYFSSNLRMDGSTKIISSARQKAQARVIGNTLLSVGAGTIYGKPLAADPYMGIGTHVNPYYTMYCLDAAYDIKARIRLVVREWDRVFPTTSSDIEYVSDLHLGINARQDVPGQVEITDDMDGIVNFNDIGSWDEFAPMSRFPGIYDPLVTYWTPYLDPTYVDGWFNPLIFPNYKKGN